MTPISNISTRQSPMNMSEPLLRAEDRVAIADLLYGYAWCLDRNQPEELGELFCEDAVVDYGPDFADIVGRENLVVAVARGQRETFAGASHHISNVRITSAGAGAADMTAYLYAWHRYRHGGPDGYLWGQYECSVRRTAEGWRIARMMLRAAGTQDFHRERMHPIQRRAELVRQSRLDPERMQRSSADYVPREALDAEDRAAIADLLYGYAWHFDRNQPEELGELFCEDAVVDYGPDFADIVGRENLVVAVARGQRETFAGASHHISNVRINPAGAGEANVTAYVYSWVRYRHGGPDGYLWGQYECSARRTAEGWHIARMMLRAAEVKNFHRERMHPIERSQ